MRERQRILERWRQRGAAALVTLVRVEGSSYRRTGARMLISPSGEYAGAISGGCLEAEVVRKAVWKVRAGAVMDRFSTLFDDTAEIPYGLGCGGTVDLLLEPSGSDEFAALMEAMEASERGEVRRVMTQLPEHGMPLRRVVLDAGGNIVAGDAAVLKLDGSRLFEEWLEPPQRLLLCGAGDDAQPVVTFATLLGWNVTVLDGRSQWATRSRFPDAACVRATSSLDGIAVGENDAAVVMTHSYEQDRGWLTALLPRGPRYLGLLGARHRSALLVSEAAAMLGWDVERVCDRIFAPVGLDLGGDGADAIALAVVAEIQACCEGKLGVSRRMSPEMVAQQIAAGGASRYLQAQCAL